MSLIDADDFTDVILIKRILKTQVALLIAAAGLTFFAQSREDSLGFDWMVFLIGCLGGTVSLHQRVVTGRLARHEADIDSWLTTLMPVLYGGVMACIAYVLFMSEVLSGPEGNGLFATNLFPGFSNPSDVGTASATGISAKDFMNIRPLTQSDLGKMWIWSFVAGYCEGFVTGMLDKLAAHVGNEGQVDQSNQAET